MPLSKIQDVKPAELPVDHKCKDFEIGNWNLSVLTTVAEYSPLIYTIYIYVNIYIISLYVTLAQSSDLICKKEYASQMVVMKFHLLFVVISCGPGQICVGELPSLRFRASEPKSTPTCFCAG